MPSAARGLNSPMGLLDLALWVGNRTVIKMRDLRTQIIKQHRHPMLVRGNQKHETCCRFFFDIKLGSLGRYILHSVHLGVSGQGIAPFQTNRCSYHRL
jgi:hypothetical protein